MKKLFAILLVCAVMFSSVDGFAMSGKKGCGMTGSMMSGRMGYKGGKFEAKLYNKARFMIKNQDELGLSDTQIKQIKDLKFEIKKEMIKQDAGIGLAKIEVKIAMWADDPDPEEIKKLAAEKYDLKKAKALYLVDAMFKMKNILSDEQQAKCKKLWMTK